MLIITVTKFGDDWFIFVDVGWLYCTVTSKVISWRSVLHMFPGFLTPVPTQLFLPKLFSHASAKVRGENTLERKVDSSGDRAHNHQVMSPKHSPLSHPAGYICRCQRVKSHPGGAIFVDVRE